MLGQLLDGSSTNEHALAVPPAERAPCGGHAGLEEHGCALRRICRVAIAVTAEVRPLVVNLVHLIGVSEDTLFVLGHRIWLLCTLPELKGEANEVICHLITLVVRHHWTAERLDGCRRRAGCDDVPSDPPLGQFIQGRYWTSKSV